jgi:hypothetical protein
MMMAAGSSPITDNQIRASIDADWFWSKVQRDADDACWPWDGDVSSHGYGCVGILIAHGKRRRRVGAHRVAYILGTGLPLGPLRALHHCDNPPCCNYRKHLFPGTAKDNSQDMSTKGRGRGPDKLTPAQVAAIKLRYGSGESATKLACEYQIHRRQVLRLASGTSRTHDTSPIITPKWRIANVRGPHVKLDAQQIVDIKAIYAAGGITQYKLADLYGVDQGHISAIINDKKRKVR